MTAPESPQPVDAPDEDKSHVPPLTTRVVIAEDEALIRLDLKEMLEEEGYTVTGPTSSSWTSRCRSWTAFRRPRRSPRRASPRC